MKEVGAHKEPLLSEEQLVINGCSGRGSHCLQWTSQREAGHAPVNSFLPMLMEVIQINLSGSFTHTHDNRLYGNLFRTRRFLMGGGGTRQGKGEKQLKSIMYVYEILNE